MATPGQLQMYNKLEVHEMFSVPEGPDGERKRIEVIPDEKVSNAVVLHTWLEDHTLGNLLRMELLRNEAVLFAGYKVRHPLDHMIELRVQTTPAIQPEAALRHAVKNLQSECSSMLDQFDEGVRRLGGVEGREANVEMSPEPEMMESEAFSAEDAEGFHQRLEAFEQRHTFSPEYLPTPPVALARSQGTFDMYKINRSTKIPAY